jgi:hypothetical protein
MCNPQKPSATHTHVIDSSLPYVHQVETPSRLTLDRRLFGPRCAFEWGPTCRGTRVSARVHVYNAEQPRPSPSFQSRCSVRAGLLGWISHIALHGAPGDTFLCKVQCGQGKSVSPALQIVTDGVLVGCRASNQVQLNALVSLRPTVLFRTAAVVWINTHSTHCFHCLFRAAEARRRDCCARVLLQGRRPRHLLHAR